ncbi:hypothetical protein MIND_00714600 [Mycena indigotica]|uniref:F-box domain-containing protein n=1 Tax=Mycena indigotica TaxID=2126181 RepID=A0A8H6SME5_9AGAR|nr:uncharacterized protein MIND_00714600 [Mycena indigotica]KAF7301492.1 hypothetical protein MIND_00714600 [Mycena indigotica]
MASHRPIWIPPEIWRVIFSFATLPPESHFVLEYVPFQRGREYEETSGYLEEESSRLNICLALIRVCRSWKTIGEEFLYHHVRLSNNASALHNFVSGLRRSADQDGLGGIGRFVWRLELPDAYFRTRPAYPLQQIATSLAELLQLCWRVQILVRPPLRLDAGDGQLWGELIHEPLHKKPTIYSNLRRLEWSESDLDFRIHGETSGQRLSEILLRSPNLEYLSLCADLIPNISPTPSLRTLRLNRSHYASRQMKEAATTRPHLPNLTHLILQASLPSAALSFLSTVGQHLCVLEFTFAPQIIYSSDQLQRIFSRCPALEELVYHLGAPELSACQHPSIRRIRLKINTDEWFPPKHVVSTQFDLFSGPAFPRLYLHDATKSFVRRHSASPLLARIYKRGCAILYTDGTAVPLRAYD